MRPTKTRWVKCQPGERCFRPQCLPLSKVKRVTLTLDEYEAIRLCDLKGLHHIEAARRMKVSRSTLSRIVSKAHTKIADALVNIKAIRIEGGSCTIRTRRRS